MKKIKTILIISLTMLITNCDMLGLDWLNRLEANRFIIISLSTNNINSIKTNPLNTHYKLEQDIDLSGYSNWTPIGTETDPFTGTFDGQGKTIKGLKITGNKKYQGFFGNVGSEAFIKNVIIKDPDIAGDEFVGSLAGKNAGSITNVQITGGQVKGDKNTGGITGRNEGLILDSSSLAHVFGTGEYIGGIAGYNNKDIEYSHSTGQINGVNNVGGVAGYSEGNITYSYASGSVIGNDNVAGLVGYNKNNTAKISRSYAEGDIRGNQNTGGLVGKNSDEGTIEDSYAIGKVTGNRMRAGGLVGYNDSTIIQCYATGGVPPVYRSGGLIGYNNSTFGNLKVENSYFSETGTGQTSGVGEGLTAGVTGYATNNSGIIVYNYNPISKNNFANWDFDIAPVWEWKGNIEWPKLVWK